MMQRQKARVQRSTLDEVCGWARRAMRRTPRRKPKWHWENDISAVESCSGASRGQNDGSGELQKKSTLFTFVGGDSCEFVCCLAALPQEARTD